MEKLFDVEVVEIYPDTSNLKKNIKEKGTVHISIKEMGLDIKNIMYTIHKNGSIYVLAPTKMYQKKPDPQSKEETKGVIVPTFDFHNKALWEHIKDVIRREIQALSDG